MTESERIENNYVFYDSFIKTYKSLESEELSVIGLDCEMVLCENGPALARVTIVNKSLEVVYDKHIKPLTPILDYLTQYSGITEEHMLTTNLTSNQARLEVLEIISKDSIICGHSLENDLLHLKISHDKVIDTSLMFPHPVVGYKHSLKTLAIKYLNKRIQCVRNKQGFHNSAEDAITVLELVFEKIKNGPSFGISKSCNNGDNFVNLLKKENKKVAEIEEDRIEELFNREESVLVTS